MGKPIEAWLYGHTHWFQDLTVNGTRVISNPHGYYRGPKVSSEMDSIYNPKFVLEI